MSNFPLQKLEAAREYSALGWPMVPTKGKIPKLKCWQNKATTEERIFSTWFQGLKNIALLMGPQAGVVAVDVDPRNGGDKSIEQLEAKLGKLPKTVTAKTGGGGYHYLFQYFIGGRNCTPASGIDFQYNNKLIIACPSIHPDTGAMYEWEISPLDYPVAELPDTWKQYLSSKLEKVVSTVSATLEQRLCLYSDDIPEGKRNDTLFKLGCSLRARRISTTLIATEVQEANLLRCKPPLSDQETVQIIKNIFNYNNEGISMKTQWQKSLNADPDLHATTKVTAMGLSFFANADGKSCWPTQEQIAENSALTRNTVAKHMDILVNSGWLKQYTKPREGTGFSYGYILTLKDAQN